MRVLLLLLFCAPAWAGDLVVELEDSRIRAADLAVALGAEAQPDLDLGPAPAPGIRRRVTRGQLERWARMAGVAAEGLPDQIVLVRKTRALKEAEAAALVRELLAERVDGDVRVELPDFAPRQIPAGDLDWKLLGAPRSTDRPVRLGLAWRDRGGRGGVESLTASITVRTQALVALADLPSGAEIAPADFRLEQTEIADLSQSYLQRIQGDKHITLKRQLKAGQPLMESLLDERPAVERGAVVELVVALGAVRLRAPARAEGSGSEGDLIPFRNLETNQRVLARVADSKTAEVTAR